MKKRVLVVDDDYDFVSLVGLILEKAGYEVLQGYNGEDALKLAEEQPDCIVLDVMMPEPDGFEVCKQLKRQEWTEDIPVVLLTAVADHVTTTRYSHYDGMNMEAEDYLPKPADAEEILDSVKSLIG